MMEMPQRLFKGCVTHITDPGSFWMQIGTDNNFDQFKVYQATIDEFYKGDDRADAATELCQNTCVVVRNKSGNGSGQWWRARVLRVEEESVDVFYVDYGYTEIVSIKDMRTMNAPFFEYLPHQAVRVGLAGIQPFSRSWTSRAVSAFEDQVLYKPVVAHVLELDESFSYAAFVVALYVKGQDGNWHSVTHLMLDDELGLDNMYCKDLDRCFSNDDVDKSLRWTNQQELAQSSEDQQETCKDASSHRPSKTVANDGAACTIEDLESSSDEEEEEEEEDLDWEGGIQSRDISNEKTFEHNPESNLHGTFQTRKSSNEKMFEHNLESVRQNADFTTHSNLEEDRFYGCEATDDPIEDLEVNSEDEDIDWNNGIKANVLSNEHIITGYRTSPTDSTTHRFINNSALAAQKVNQVLPAAGEIPQFNLGVLSHTRALTANTMQENIGAESQKLRLEMLKDDLRRCKEDMHEGLQYAGSVRFEWGRSDSQVGEPHREADSDIQDSILEEINNKSLNEEDEIQALRKAFQSSQPYAGVKNHVQNTAQVPVKSRHSPLAPESKPKSTSHDTWTEEECYKIEKNVAKAIETKDIPASEMMTLIHSIIPPGSNISHQCLTLVVTPILESITRNKCYEPSVALTVLETYAYADAELFLDVLVNSLKDLKDKFVKLSQSIRNSSNHEGYATLLGMLFIQSCCWPLSLCQALQSHILGVMDKFVIFNKKRQQDQASSTDTELMYLDCVSIFIRHTRDILSTQFAEHLRLWLDEIEEKLLHDLTKRSVRVLLLNILRDNLGNMTPDLTKQRCDCATVGTQTEAVIGQEFPNALFKKKYEPDGPFYKAPRGTLYARQDPYSPHQFIEEIDVETVIVNVPVSQNSAEVSPSGHDPVKSSAPKMTSTYSVGSKECSSRLSALVQQFVSPVEDVRPYKPSPSQHSFVTEDTSFAQTKNTSDNLNWRENAHMQAKSLSDDLDWRKKSFPHCESYSDKLHWREDITESNQTDLEQTALPIKRYTSEFLKSLDPLQGNPQRPGIVLTEPYELKHVFHRILEGETEASGDAWPNPSDRYSSKRTKDPIEVSDLPGSNKDKLNILSSFLSDSIKFHRSHTETENNLSHNFNENASGNSVVESENVGYANSNYGVEDTQQAFSNYGLYDSNKEVEDWTDGINKTKEIETSPNAEERSNVNKTPNLERPDNYFRSVKAANTSADLEQLENSENEDQQKMSSSFTQASKKKKKTKFRPLDDFQVGARTVSVGVDESGPGFADLDEYDEFSPEALQMYMRMEEAERELKAAEGRMLHGPRMSMNSGSRARPSLFAEIRKTKSPSVAQPWVPGKRKCTRCGSDKHILVDCHEGTTINNIDDSSYLF